MAIGNDGNSKGTIIYIITSCVVISDEYIMLNTDTMDNCTTNYAASNWADFKQWCVKERHCWGELKCGKPTKWRRNDAINHGLIATIAKWNCKIALINKTELNPQLASRYQLEYSSTESDNEPLPTTNAIGQCRHHQWRQHSLPLSMLASVFGSA